MVSAEEFVWQERRFGRLRAEIVREPQGLRMQKFTHAFAGSRHRGHRTLVRRGRRLAQRARPRGHQHRSPRGLGRARLSRCDRGAARLDRRTPHLAGRADRGCGAALDGRVHVELEGGQLRNVEPGAAGRVLGLMSVVELPRRLALDFRDVTDEGSRSTPCAAISRCATAMRLRRTCCSRARRSTSVSRAGPGSRTQDYDQTVVVSGNPGGPLAVAGALAAGPVVGAGVLVLSQLFKGQLQGLTRAYYRVTGPWAAPVVERISAPRADGLPAAQEAAAALSTDDRRRRHPDDVGRGRRAQSRRRLAVAARRAARRAPSSRRCPRTLRSWAAPKPTSSRSPRADGDGPDPALPRDRRAREFGMWIVAGTMPMRDRRRRAGRGRLPGLRRRPAARVARYDKIHLFDVSIPGRDERYLESKSVQPGTTPVCVDTPAGRLGLAVCYDVRFPELFRELGRAGADWFCLPSAFTAPTGRAHWEVLLRARAIENLVHVVAPAQSGFHENGRETYGDSMIVDCWGRVQSPAAARHRGRDRRESGPRASARGQAQFPRRSTIADSMHPTSSGVPMSIAIPPALFAPSQLPSATGVHADPLDARARARSWRRPRSTRTASPACSARSWVMPSTTRTCISRRCARSPGRSRTASSRTARTASTMASACARSRARRHGFAYSDEVVMPALLEAARAARAIARGGHDGRAAGLACGRRARPVPADRSDRHARRPRQGAAARGDRPRGARARFAHQPGHGEPAASHDTMLVLASDGTLAADVRPLVRLNVSVIIEHEGRREQGYAGGGGRFAYTEFLESGERWRALVQRGRAHGAGQSRGSAGAGRHDDRGARVRAGPACCCTRRSVTVSRATSTARARRRSAAASASRSPSTALHDRRRRHARRVAAARSTSTTKARRRSARR